MMAFQAHGRRPKPLDGMAQEAQAEESAVSSAMVPEGPRRAMQRLYGESLDHVRLRITDHETTALGGSSARAAAYADTIWLRPADYRPGSIRTDAILAHELAHIRQQSGPGSAGSANLERAADEAAVMSLAPGSGPGRAPRLFGGLRLQRCTPSEVPDLSQLGVDAKAAIIRRALEEDRYNRDTAVYAVFQSAAEQGQFVDLQGPLDMDAVLSAVHSWTAVRIGSLGPVTEGVAKLTEKRVEIIRDMTNDYGLAYGQLFTAFIFDTTQDDQIKDVLRALASQRRLGDTVGKMPAIKDRLTARGINLDDFPDRPRQASDIARGLGAGISDILDSSQAAKEGRGMTLQRRIIDLPGPYAEAGQDITRKIFEEAMSPGNVALGAIDYALFGVPSGVYGLVSGTVSGVGNLISGNLEEGARQLVPALITIATLLIGRAAGGPKGGGAEPPPSAGPSAGGGAVRVRFAAPGIGGAITLEQAIAQFPVRLQGPVALLRAAFTEPEILEGAKYVRQSAPAAALVEQEGATGMRALINSGGDVPKATAIMPVVAATLTGSRIAKPEVAPPTVPGDAAPVGDAAPTEASAKPMPSGAEMVQAASAANSTVQLATIVAKLVKNRTGKYKGPLPIFWPELGGKGLIISAPNPANSIFVGRPLKRKYPSPERDEQIVEDFKMLNTVLTGQAVHHVTPLMMGGPDSTDNLAAVWISYHVAGHGALRMQYQLKSLGYSSDPERHPDGTPYVVVLII